MDNDKIAVDFNGHFFTRTKNGAEYYRKKLLKDAQLVRMGLFSDEGFSAHEKNQETLKAGGTIVGKGLTDTCFQCCEEYSLAVSRDKVSVVEACSYPDGFPEYSVSINVPSGKLVIGNDFRDLFSINPNYDINYAAGCKDYSEAYADVGMICIFVGNTCPGIYQLDNQTLHIANAAYEEKDDNLEYSHPAKNHGGICTDLWWYSAMDYDLYRKLYEETYKREFSAHETVVEIEPGLYKATARCHILDRDSSGEMLFSVIERVGDCKTIKSQSSHEVTQAFLEEAFDNTVNTMWLNYNDSIFPTRESVLRHIFLVIGTGCEWRDGLISVGVSARTVDGVKRLKAGEKPFHNQKRLDKDRKLFPDPDEKTKDCRFYPISDNYSPITMVPDDVRPDWLAGCHEIIDIVLEKENDSPRGKENKETCKRIKAELLERFGDAG